MECYLGLDFGTLSARAVLISENDGSIIGESVYDYPHGVITGNYPTWALADPDDYREALLHSIRDVIEKTGIDTTSVKAIGIDATTYSMVPCVADGRALAELESFRNEPHAFIKLWKHHGADKQAQRIEALHASENCFPAIDRYGHVCNCEWALPKLLEVYEEAKNVFDAADRFCDLGEWIAWILTGKPVNSMYSAGYKGMWTPEYGFPTINAINLLSPGFGEAVYQKFIGPIKDYARPCGFLIESEAKLLGLPEGIPIATPIGDGSAPGVYFCAKYPDALAITLGTSVAMAFTSKEMKPITGINGVVKDGIIPGYYCYDAGQPCAGDMLAWFVKNQIPSAYYQKAKESAINIHQYISNLAEANNPESNTLTVLDWFNGNRSILNNSSLRGSIIGLSLDTKPEEVYGAMVQGIACGMRVILEHLNQNEIFFNKIIVCGGIAEKNPFIRHEYANILNREILISSKKNITAISAAMLAAVASGKSWESVTAQMCQDTYITVKSDPKYRKEYDIIYQRYKYYHDLLSQRTFQ